MSPALPREQWFVAKTRYFRQEMKVRDWLAGRNIEAFVPTIRTRVARRSGGTRSGERPAAPNLVFIRTDKKTACSLVADWRLPMSYMTDCATHKMLVVPDKAMSDFQRVFACSVDEGGLVGQPIAVGERVRVAEGPLKDVEGSVAQIQGDTYVVVDLLGFLWAKAKIPRAWLEKLE